MATSERFRVERRTDLTAERAATLGTWYVVREREDYRFPRAKPEKEYLLRSGEWSTMNWHNDTKHGWYHTEAEATFRLALYQNPREALAAFLTATGGEYEGSCNDCDGSGKRRPHLWVPGFGPGPVPCHACSGTGGPPARAGEISDWYERAGADMEAGVLRSLANASA